MPTKLEKLKAEIDAENLHYAELMAEKQRIDNMEEINRKKLVAHHNRYDSLRKQYNDELKKSWK
jgi:hypothetical protein